MATLQVTWIDKPGGSSNPHTHIQRLGGTNWQDTEANVIQAINGQINSYYVIGSDGKSTWVEVDYRNQVPYLRTQSDGTPLDNLLSLRNVSTIR